MKKLNIEIEEMDIKDFIYKYEITQKKLAELLGYNEVAITHAKVRGETKRLKRYLGLLDKVLTFKKQLEECENEKRSSEELQ